MKTAAVGCLTLLVLTQVRAGAAEPQLEVALQREQIYLGESVLLEVKVTGADGGPEPDLSAITNCQVKPLGARTVSNYSFTFVNGELRKQGYSGRIFTYELTPRVAGEFLVGPVVLRAAGRTLEVPGPKLRVIGVQPQDLVDIRVTASRDAVLVDEPFEIRLTILLRRLPGAHADLDPLFPDAPPVLTVPFLDTAEIPGLRGPDIAQLLRSRLVETDQPGFAINKFTTTHDPFDVGRFFSFRDPWERRPARFRLDRRAVERNGQPYFEYSLALTYSPLEEGSYAFGPVLFKGAVPTEVDARGQAASRDVFAVGPAVTVRVVPPPEEGRPDWYVGALGSNLTVEATLDTQTCNVGDPVQLTITLAGDVQMRNVRPLRLSLQTNVLAHFDVYDDSVRTVKGEQQRQYVYTLRPRHPGTFELPPIAVAYYDVNTRTYHTVYSRPIPFKALPTAEVGAAQIVGAVSTAAPRAALAVPRDSLTPAGIRVDPMGAHSSPLLGDIRVLGVLVGSGPTVFALALGLRALARYRPVYAERRRRRGALRRACRALTRACRQALRAGAIDHRVVVDILRDYVADRCGLPAGRALTPDEIRGVLAALALPPGVLDRFHGLLNRHFHAAFGGTPSPAGDDAFAEAQAALREVEAALGNRSATGASPRPRQSATALVLGLLLMGGFARTGLAVTAAEREFLWNEAQTRLATAVTPADFLTAAGVYERLLDLKVRNATLFYNLGTALLNAGRYEEAVAALLRAERYGGTAPDIARNLAVAQARRLGLKEPVVPWQHTIFFWHYGLACSTRALIAATALLVVWVLLAFRLLSCGRRLRPLLVPALAVFVVFASSTATTWHQETMGGAARPTGRLQQPDAGAPNPGAAGPHGALDSATSARPVPPPRTQPDGDFGHVPTPTAPHSPAPQP